MPKYYDKFKCIADKCTDNCCIGWEIEVDSSTNEFYNKVPGKFGKKLRENIKDGCFILGEDERCPFLNSKNKPNNKIETKTKASIIAKSPNELTEIANGYKKIVSISKIKNKIA